MNIQQLITSAQQPEIYTPGTACMWSDKHISTQLLKVHLDQNLDLASRKKSTIDSTLDWISARAPGENLQILDLGCGPGLYAERLAQRGHHVTGMDLSAHSIAHAKKSAATKNLHISYIQQNYLELEETEKYDLILLIFTDFGVLTPSERTILLHSINRALKPGGKFIFDVMNDRYSAGNDSPRQWEMTDSGFWSDSPYLALSETFSFNHGKVSLTQHLVIDQMEKVEIYRFWMHTFSHEELQQALLCHGFSKPDCYDGVVPDSSFHRSNEVTFCITEK